MRLFLLALPLLALAACETTPQPYAPVESVRYQAAGADPFWLLTIGDDRIVLRMAGLSEDAVYPRTLPRTVEGVTIWQSGDSPSITVQKRSGPCTNRSGQTFEDQVRIRLSGDNLRTLQPGTEELHGCGGRLIGQERR